MTINKEMWLDIAEIVDALRIFARLLVFGYAWFVWCVVFEVLHWYFKQPAIDRGIEESSVVGAVITAVTGFAPVILKIYMNSSRDWNADRSSRSSISTVRTEVRQDAKLTPA